jgi:hypothetical protein
MNKLLDAYNQGFTSGKYTFTYIHPDSNQDELNEWARGFKDGKQDNYNPANKQTLNDGN